VCAETTDDSSVPSMVLPAPEDERAPLVFRYTSFPSVVAANEGPSALTHMVPWDLSTRPQSRGPNVPGSVVLLGAAMIVAERLVLLPRGSSTTVAAAWHRRRHPIAGGFSTRFQVHLEDTGGRAPTGLAFTLRHGNQSGFRPVHGVDDLTSDPFFAIAINNNHDPKCKHTRGLHLSIFSSRANGHHRILSCASLADYESTNGPLTVTIRGSRQELSVEVDGRLVLQCAVDVAAEIGHPTALVGFTALGKPSRVGTGLFQLVTWSFGSRAAGPDSPRLHPIPTVRTVEAPTTTEGEGSGCGHGNAPETVFVAKPHPHAPVVRRLSGFTERLVAWALAFGVAAVLWHWLRFPRFRP